MAATLITDLIRQVRTPLKDQAAYIVSGDPYWTDQEIVDHFNNGAQILWRAIVDLYDHHFTVVDDGNFFIEAEAGYVYGVPETVHRVTTLEPRVLGEDNPNRSLVFSPADWNSDKFTVARARGPIAPNNAVVYYTLMSAGAPVGPPVIRIAPRLREGMLLSCTYVSTLSPIALSASARNPIPGASDQALINYAVAQCRAKDNDQQIPDATWMALFATERTDLLAKLDKRQDQQPDVVEGMFEGVGDYDGGFQ
jgi:hypothetical protein